MNLKIEIEYNLSDELLVTMEKLNIFSKVPKINTTSEFFKVFNTYLIEDFKPLIVKVIDLNINEVVGIFPLMYKDYFRRKIMPFRAVKFFGSTFSDFHDIYAKNEYKEDVVNTVLNWLFSKQFRWQELILDDLLETSEIIKPIANFLKINHHKFSITEGKYFYINLENPWDDIKKETSKNFVWKNVRLAKNRITKAGEWEIEFNPKLKANEIINRAKPIHIERQKTLKRESRYSNEKDVKAYHEIVDNFMVKNQFNTFWLKFNNKYIGYMLGFYIDNTFYWWNTAFLEAYKEFYPSKLLQYFVLEYMHEKNYKEFNFMRGESGYKDKWTKTTRPNYRFRIYNNKSIYGKFLGLFDKNFR